jgi:hypothetical protein
MPVSGIPVRTLAASNVVRPVDDDAGRVTTREGVGQSGRSTTMRVA